jgi:mono/diheme cytochrome c family protein
VNHCASCHGLDGDGKGPAAHGLDPPPRDFRAAQFKFAAVRSGELPNDDDLARLIAGGLDGTAMPAWGLDADDVTHLADFVKTFPPPGCAPAECGADNERAGRWTRRRRSGPRAGELAATTGAPIAATRDPWAGREAEAARRGEALYHREAQCSQCHPSYLPDAARAATVLGAANNPYGVDIRPPDFGRERLRSIRPGRELGDLYRVIAAGVGGVMPAWIDALGQEELWALAHYVHARTKGER